MILGNIDGIKNSALNSLEALYSIKVPRTQAFTEEISNVICNVSAFINREVSVAIDRKGNVISIAVGDSSTVEMPIIDIAEKKLSGIRIIHTHPSGNSNLSLIDLSALTKMKLDTIVAIGVKDGKANTVSLGFCMVENDTLKSEEKKGLSLEEAINYDILDKIQYIESLIKVGEIVEDYSERAILVGIDSEESLEELAELAKACEIEPLAVVFQNKTKVDTATYIGSGKVEEVTLIRQACNANLVIFDDELKGSQVRNLEEILGVKVVDRTTLILDIFARRARSKEAKIQVELAQLKYRMTRLTGLGAVLSRTGGGIGTRGPGEKKLEVDRRHIRERVYDLSKELEKVRTTREVQREKRRKGNIPKISLVGYTNAGKSTLRNKLCEIAAPEDVVNKEKIFEADMLFATLDVTTRAIELPDKRVAALTDTVGFVRKLPHDLVEAFKSTLEEVIYSDLLLHVVDCSSDYAMEQINAVNNVLTQLGAIDKPIIILLNKVDKAPEDRVKEIEGNVGEYSLLRISAKQNINLDVLLNKICEFVPSSTRKTELLIPYSDQSVTAYIHRKANIDEESYEENGTHIIAHLDEEAYNKCRQYVIN
ncbi:MAG: GTPase HflX [Bacillota bacterium]|nr:GTPase HflX [Bacillota bacterium]